MNPADMIDRESLPDALRDAAVALSKDDLGVVESAGIMTLIIAAADALEALSKRAERAEATLARTKSRNPTCAQCGADLGSVCSLTPSGQEVCCDTRACNRRVANVKGEYAR